MDSLASYSLAVLGRGMAVRWMEAVDLFAVLLARWVGGFIRARVRRGGRSGSTIHDTIRDTLLVFGISAERIPGAIVHFPSFTSLPTARVRENNFACAMAIDSRLAKGAAYDVARVVT